MCKFEAIQTSYFFIRENINFSFLSICIHTDNQLNVFSRFSIRKFEYLKNSIRGKEILFKIISLHTGYCSICLFIIDRFLSSRSEEHTSELQSRENLVC